MSPPLEKKGAALPERIAATKDNAQRLLNLFLSVNPNDLSAHSRMRSRCIQCALENTPSNVRYVQIRNSLSGFAAIRGSIEIKKGSANRVYGLGCLAAPRPFTRKSLYIFLHECAHFELHAGYKYGERPRYVEEYEAEQWAHARMKEAEIPVPRSMTKRAKQYVARKLEPVKRKKGRRINPKLLAFARRTS